MKACLIAAVMLMVASAAEGACAEKRSRSPQFVMLAVPDGAPRPTSVADFSFIDESTTVEQLSAKIGPPDAADGDRVPILVYCLPDGSEVRVSSRDGKAIDQVRHDGRTIFKRGKK